jgi:hypothetical protein
MPLLHRAFGKLHEFAAFCGIMRTVVFHINFTFERGAKMKSLAGIGTFSILFVALASPMFADEQPPAQDTSQAEKAAESPKPRFTISKETTYLSKPLRADGRVDYIAVLNKICSEGVTPENNAVVLFLQALGPENIGADFREGNYRMIGIAPLPEKGDYLIPFEKFSEKFKKESGEAEEEAASQNSAKQLEELDKFYKTMNSPWTAEKFPLYAEWLKANQKPLEKIREAVLRPRYFAPLIPSDEKTDSMISALLFMIQESRSCARLLMAHAMFSLGEGRIADARQDILACHLLARLGGQGPTLVDALIAIAIDGMACTGDIALAQSGTLSPQEASNFQEELRKLPPMPKIADKIDLAERFLFLDCVEIMATNGFESIMAMMGNDAQNKDDLLKSFLASNLPSAFDWDVVLRMGNAWYDRMVEAGRKPSYAQRAGAWQKLEDEVKKMAQDVKSLKSVGGSLMAGESVRAILSKKLGNILFCLLTPGIGSVINAEERGKVYSDLSQIALALGAYRSDRGNYPDRLAELAPKYIAEVPKDGFSEADFIYRREGNGYLLYSVGGNGKDDGGKSTYNDPPDENGDDFVIRTPKEVK